MRWELLFADLEGQLAAAEATELSMEVAERSRHELGALSIVDRLLAALGAPVRCGTVAGDVLAGVIAEVGPDWLLIADPVTGAYEELVALGAVGWVEGLGRASAGGAKGPVWQRLNLRHALRALSRERAVIDVAVTGSPRCAGTLDRVGADYIDIAVHPADEPRRPSSVRAVRTVPLATVISVRRVP